MLGKAMTRTWLFLGLCILMSCSSSQPDLATSPYPESPIVTGVTWAPVTTIVRQALGSDNWPITWGDDGHLYTSGLVELPDGEAVLRMFNVNTRKRVDCLLQIAGGPRGLASLRFCLLPIQLSF